MKTVYRLAAFFSILGVLLVNAGCSSSQSHSEPRPQDKNEATLETVLENTFTGPDKKLNRLSDPENVDIPDDQDETDKIVSPANSELDSYLDKMYRSHFTENMYDKYISKFVFTYQANEHDDMSITNIDIKQKDSNEMIYDFTADVKYQEENSKMEDFSIKGQANLTEKRKIEGFKIHADDELAKAISKR